MAGFHGFLLTGCVARRNRSDAPGGVAHTTVAEGHLRIRSEGLVDECLTFITTDSGSQEAQPGKQDDRVMAAAIAWQVRKRPKPQVGGFFV